MDEYLERLREMAWDQYTRLSQYIEFYRRQFEAEKKAAVDDAEQIIKRCHDLDKMRQNI
jgi:hypothetical protein